jgi:protein-S-isoprenylcysteine O-methyltransferase Ste14
MEKALTRSGKIAFLAPVRWIFIAAVVFFIAAGKFDSIRAWSYIGIYTIGGMGINLLLLRKSPQLLNDRGEIKTGAKQWDKLIILLYFFLGLIVTPLIAGLDDRWEWHLLPIAYWYVGVGLYLFSMGFITWPMLYNRFFEGMVRIQEEKNHTVVKTGPYRFVRHPGYVGMLTGAFAMPLAFGSFWGLVPAACMAVVVIIRTWFEDKTLQEELEGYKAYCQEVKYRLIPYLW